MTILYLSQFSIIKEIVSLDHIIAKILRLTLFSHIEDISYDGTSITIISLHLILFAILWLKISNEHICHGRFDNFSNISP
ncbi:hypothetical protein HZS_6790 [Henneguya salminicola]|nr:hypothetical protein HZS_6790 [Henneguya salminicola]